MDSLKEQFILMGLENCDVDLYLTLLHHGEMTASDLSKKLSISRSSALRKLECLIDTGLVKKVANSYTCQPPENLLRIVETQKSEVLAREELAQNILMRLEPLYHRGQKKTYFYNIDNIQELRRAQRVFETLEDDILQIVSLDSCIQSLREDSLSEHRSALKESGKKVRAIIVGNSDKNIPDIQAEYVLLPPDLSPVTGEVTLCGDYILMFSYQSPGKFSAVEIHSKEIANTLRFVLELAWQRGLELSINK